MVTKKSASSGLVEIKPLSVCKHMIPIIGISQYVSNRYGSSDGVRDGMTLDPAEKAKQKKEAKDKPRDFNAEYLASMHVAVTEFVDGELRPCKEPWYGIPCSGFMAAFARATSVVANLAMTEVKLMVKVLPDGYSTDGFPLVRIRKGDPVNRILPTRTPPGPTGKPNFASRGHWDYWECDLIVEYDDSRLTMDSVVNLIERAGYSVGVGAGRPFSSSSCGQGWGMFKVRSDKAA